MRSGVRAPHRPLSYNTSNASFVCLPTIQHRRRRSREWARRLQACPSPTSKRRSCASKPAGTFDISIGSGPDLSNSDTRRPIRCIERQRRRRTRPRAWPSRSITPLVRRESVALLPLRGLVDYVPCREIDQHVAGEHRRIGSVHNSGSSEHFE